MEAPALAIDFGTSRTKVAYFDGASRKGQLVELGREIRSVLPSVFYIPKEGQGERLVGDDAQDMVDSDPEGIVLSLKKELHKLGKKRCGPERPAIDRIQLASDLFSHINRRCRTEVFHAQEIKRCQLTVPVDFKAQQREAIREAAKLGGFEEITLIEEPVAAAQHWLRNHQDEKLGNSVVVCDVGGGTTDFAFLRYANGRFQADDQVLSDGFPTGGNDLDEAIWEMTTGSDPNRSQYESQTPGFLVHIRRQRELISKTQNSDIQFIVHGLQCTIPRSTFEAATTEFVGRVRTETERFLETIANKVQTRNTPILLVGGASKLPGLRDALKSLNQGEVFLWSDSDYATVLGAVDIPSEMKSKRFDGNHGTKAKIDYDLALTMTEDGRCDEGFEVLSNAMLSEDIDPKIFLLWIESARSVSDYRKVLEKAQHLYRTRNNDSWGAGALASVFFDFGRDGDAEDLVNSFSLSEATSGFPLRLISLFLQVQKQNFKQLLELDSEDIILGDPIIFLMRSIGLAQQKAKQYNWTPEVLRQDIGTSFNATLGRDRLFLTHFYLLLYFHYEVVAFVNDDDIAGILARMKRVSSSNYQTKIMEGYHNIASANYQDAISNFDQAIKDPRSHGKNGTSKAKLLSYRSRCYRQLNNNRAALADIESCLLLSPDNVDALGERGGLLYADGKYEDSLRDFSRCVELSSKNTSYLKGRAFCLHFLSRNKEAVKDFEAAYQIDSSDREALHWSLFCTIVEILKQIPNAIANTYLSQQIPSTKLENAFRSYLSPLQLTHAEEVLLLFDNTGSGSAIDGFCLTADTLYWHNPGEAMSHFLRYSAIKEVSISGHYLCANNLAINCQYSHGNVGAFKDIVTQLARMLSRLQPHNKSGTDGSARCAEAAVQSAPATSLSPSHDLDNRGVCRNCGCSAAYINSTNTSCKATSHRVVASNASTSSQPPTNSSPDKVYCSHCRCLVTPTRDYGLAAAFAAGGVIMSTVFPPAAGIGGVAAYKALKKRKCPTCSTEI